VSLH